MTTRERRKFTPEFKREAVKLAEQPGRSLTDRGARASRSPRTQRILDLGSRAPDGRRPRVRRGDVRSVRNGRDNDGNAFRHRFALIH